MKQYYNTSNEYSVVHILHYSLLMWEFWFLRLWYIYLYCTDSLDACLKAKRRFLLDHPDVTCFYTSNKIIGGKETDQRCLVIGVREKRKESELEGQRVLPKEIQHGWFRHLVDVVEEDPQVIKSEYTSIIEVYLYPLHLMKIVQNVSANLLLVLVQMLCNMVGTRQWFNYHGMQAIIMWR